MTDTTQPPAASARGPGLSRVVIEISTPAGWIVRHFFRIGRHRAAGIVMAFSPRVFALGLELMTGFGKGGAIIVGPLWIGFAVADITQDQDGGSLE